MCNLGVRTSHLVQNWTRLAFLNVIDCMEGLFIIACSLMVVIVACA
jgi:hypothetical protein